MTTPIQLEKPIPRGEGQIDTITLRKPDAGALRGIVLSDLLRMEAGAVADLLPRGMGFSSWMGAVMGGTPGVWVPVTPRCPALSGTGAGGHPRSRLMRAYSPNALRCSARRSTPPTTSTKFMRSISISTWPSTVSL